MAIVFYKSVCLRLSWWSIAIVFLKGHLLQRVSLQLLSSFACARVSGRWQLSSTPDHEILRAPLNERASRCDVGMVFVDRTSRLSAACCFGTPHAASPVSFHSGMIEILLGAASLRPAGVDTVLTECFQEELRHRLS